MIGQLKHLIKKYLWRLAFGSKTNKRAALQNAAYVTALTTSQKLPQQQLNVFTKENEDGILLYIFSKIGIGSKFFVDIGSNDCINSNCANLAFHHGWSGVFIDGNSTVLNRGKYIYKQRFKHTNQQFEFIHSIVTTGNINNTLKDAQIVKEPDLLCIDLDGNDYHIWKAITVINPKVVLAEVQMEKGLQEFVPDYDTEFELYEDDRPKGASPLSMQQLANEKGYRLVAANKGGYNLFFVREDCLAGLKTLNIERLYKAH